LLLAVATKVDAMPAESETTERGLPEALKGLIGLWVLLFALWLIVNASLALPVVLTGAVISLAIASIFSLRYGLWQQTALTPGAAYHFLAFASVFFIELVKANVNMLRYVYSPRIDIHPGIVRIPMRLKSPIGRLALANAIALTPGSLVMDIRDDALFVHWLDVKTTDPEQAAAMIAGPFEKHLGAAFG